MLHPDLPAFVKMAREKGFIPVLTTNGTLLKGERAEALIEAKPHKIQISLHSHEGNGFDHASQYIDEVMTFAQKAAEAGIIVVLRLWNEGGFDSANTQLKELMGQHIAQPWTQRYDGWKLTEKIYLELH